MNAAEVIAPDSLSQPGMLICCRSLISADSKRCILSKVPCFAEMLESINDDVIHETCGV